MADKTTDRCACDALGRGAPGLHTRDCRTRTVLGMLLQDRTRPEPHMELRGLPEVRTVADAERLFGKGSTLVEGDATVGFPGLRRMLAAPVKALAFHHLVQGFAEHDHARFVELTGSADDSGAEEAPVAHPTEEDP